MFGLKKQKGIPKFEAFVKGLNFGLSSVSFNKRFKLIVCFHKTFIY